MRARVCELCGKQATLYCSSDSAYLCSTCDSNVHRANFLVARHLRLRICSVCDCLTGVPFSGPGSPDLCHVCDSCSPEKEVETVLCTPSSSSSSSACLSSTESFVNKKCLGGGVAKIASSSTVTEDSGEAVSNRLTSRGEKSKSRSVMEANAEGIFVNWLRNLGLKTKGGHPVVSSAIRAFRICLDRAPVLPFRLSLAASFWLGVRFSGDRSLATW